MAARSEATTKSSLRAISLYGMLTVCALVILVPIAALVLLAFSPDALLLSGPSGLSLEQFRIAFERLDFWHYAGNSLLLGVVYTVPVVASSFCAGYAFARLRARGSAVLFGVVIATMLVPTFVYLIPLFVVYSRIGLTNTVVPWLLWGIAGNAFYIFLFRQYFDAFPTELEEAGMLDGLTRWGILMRIVAPNSYTMIATVVILAFTNVWGEVLLQGVLLNQVSAETLSVRLSSGVLDELGNAVLIGPTLAAIVVYVLPPVVVFIVFQRFIIRGVATSGLK